MSAACLLVYKMTVRDFMEFVMKEAGVSRHTDFNMISEEHLKFFDRLILLGWEKKTKLPEDTDNVDATALLTDKEWHALETEFFQLHHGT